MCFDALTLRVIKEQCQESRREQEENREVTFYTLTFINHSKIVIKEVFKLKS